MDSLRLLGTISRLVRRVGLGRAFAVGRDLADRVLLALDRPPLRAKAGGVEVRGYLRHRSFLARLSGDYELLSRAAFLEGLADADVVVDAGAHLGFYTLLAAGRRPDARIVALEPDPYNVAALRANLRRAGEANTVEVIAAAAAAHAGSARFQQSLGTTGSSLVTRSDTGPSRVIEVETAAIADVLGDVTGVRLLVKLDIEGAERWALQGARSALQAAATVTALVELNPRALVESGSSQAELIHDLEALGLSVLFLDEQLGSPVPAEPPLPKGNLLCRRTSPLVVPTRPAGDSRRD